MSVLVVGTVAFDAIETPFGKTNKIVGMAGILDSSRFIYFLSLPNSCFQITF